MTITGINSTHQNERVIVEELVVEGTLTGNFDASGTSVTATGGATQTLADWMADVENAPQSFSGNSIQSLRLTQDIDHRVEIIKDDDSPLNYQATRAGIVYQHRDTLDAGQQITVPAVVFTNIVTGDGYVTAASDSSETVWSGVHSIVKKYGDGSGHAWTATGELHEYGAGLYNECGLFQGIVTNLGSTHGAISGVEVNVRDGTSGTNFDTRMYSVAGRMARWNGGSRASNIFVASSEGDEEVDTVLSINPTGTQPFTNGIDLREGTFSGYPYMSAGFNVNFAGDIAAKTVGVGAASGLVADPFYAIQAHAQQWAMRGATATGNFYLHDQTNAKFPLVIAPNTGVVTLIGALLTMSATAIPAGGVVTAAIKMSSTANFGMFFGSGAPTLSAAKGSLYLRSDGTTTNDRMYVNTNGTTGWTAVTTAS